ncbi:MULTISPECIES: hypothetical protein [unclassified Streptomyces]|uniref:hypothetical protein n=1 Tax=unclassified Streptomyces TaxID=2593676 RepID=UPI00381DFCDD
MVNSAQVRTDLGDGASGVDLCEAALDEPSAVVPTVRILAMRQQAHGVGLPRGRAAVDRLIDAADRPRVDDEPLWGNACRRTPGYLEVRRATCYGCLGTEAGRAVDSGARRRAVDRPPGPRCPHGPVRHGCGGRGVEPEQAVEIAREVVEIAVETGSARVRRELVTLERAMWPWHDAPVGRCLAEAPAPVREGS